MALRTSLAPQPHLYMGDVTGKPLDYGMVYFGQPNKDPEFYPIDIYYDESLTVAAAQPVRTKGGFLNANGDMVEVYAAETEYSVKVLDGYGRQVFYQARMVRDDPSAPTSVTIPYPNAVPRYQGDKNAEIASLRDFGATGNAVADDTTPVTNAANVGLKNKIDGNSLAYAVSSKVEDYSKFKKAAFATPDGLIYPTEDYLDAELSRITITPTYTAWAQDKACVHNGVIYVPIMMGYGHTYAGMKLAWVKSFDGGSTWTSPEILLDVNPNSAYGWNCFSAGVINNRFVMIVEERSTVDKSLVNLYIYDRVLALSKLKSSSINLTAGSAIATITEPNNGLCVGDKVNFSSVSGTDVGGLTGTLTVTGIIDANTFQVNKGTVSATTQTNTGGSAWYLGATFYNNPWRITPLSLFPNGAGQSITHSHSFTVRDATAGRFFFGIHNSNGSREIGFVDVSNFWKTPTTVKRRIPSTFEPSQAEPCVNYLNGKTYLTTRGQSNTSNGSVFAWSADDGLTWTAARFPKNLHYSPLPFTIYDGVAYIFGTERRPNEWLSTTDTSLQQGRTRSFMMKAPIAELEALDFSNLTTLTLSYGRYQGEQASSACGVGSVILYEDSLRYYFGSEDYKDSTRYSLNSPSTDNEYLADGYQPDMFEYRIELKKPLAGINTAMVRCPDNSFATFYRKGNEFLSLTPYTWVKPQKFTSTVDVLGDISFGRFLKSVNSAYLAVLPDTASGSDTRFATLAGGGAVSGSRGGMISVYGAQHATNPNDIVFSTTTALLPSSDNTANIGSPSRRIKDVFTVNAVTSTSDANLKDIDGSPDDTLIQPLLNIAKNIKVFKWKDGGNRKHIGVIAQEVCAEFETAGIDAFDYGFIGKDLAYDDVVTGRDDDGQDIVERQPRLDDDGNHVEIWNVRHSELQYAILWAQIQKLK